MKAMQQCRVETVPRRGILAITYFNRLRVEGRGAVDA